jgi:hypothetical protein
VHAVQQFANRFGNRGFCLVWFLQQRHHFHRQTATQR